ncbi:hypothetical protein SAMN04488128_10334 [Chitinophaga eiseniae]|uniref:Uncharacterized protein n=1 Tax=Chitinophaga eiseniae TaxID=634771 RepID=A0A1T4SKM7_9BACT|nr:hypothetical protein [Chitinophaga eiseniae]SKA28840.1 hypothetical protein SAMN04488128_10334 [Chitinophaga eiseniae]
MNRFFLLLLMAAAFTACKNETPANNHTRIVFDAGDLHFIASSLNPKLKTMSAVYGNDSALQALAKGDHQPAAGAVLKLVTWRYHDNPQYFGGKINGELLSVETLQAGSWQLDFGALQHPATAAERISYIMSYQPVQIP